MEGRKVRLVIEMDEHENIQLAGPISQPGLCYGMLELAKDAIREHNRTNQALVQPASGPLPPLRGM